MRPSASELTEVADMSPVTRSILPEMIFRRAADDRPVRFRHRLRILLLPGRGWAGALELLGGARDDDAQADRQTQLGTDHRLRAECLADRRLGLLFRRNGFL